MNASMNRQGNKELEAKESMKKAQLKSFPLNKFSVWVKFVFRDCLEV